MDMLLHIRNFDFSDNYTTIGTEIELLDKYTFRAGYQIPSDPQKDIFGEKSHIFDFALGLGCALLTESYLIYFDYAFRNVQYLESNNLFSMRFEFK